MRYLLIGLLGGRFRRTVHRAVVVSPILIRTYGFESFDMAVGRPDSPALVPPGPTMGSGPALPWIVVRCKSRRIWYQLQNVGYFEGPAVGGRYRSGAGRHDPAPLSDSLTAVHQWAWVAGLGVTDRFGMQAIDQRAVVNDGIRFHDGNDDSCP